METPVERIVRLASLRSVGASGGTPRVRTPQGAKKYGEPIGAPIQKNVAAQAPGGSSSSFATRSSTSSSSTNGSSANGSSAPVKGGKSTKKYGPHNTEPVDLTRSSIMRKSKIPPKVYNTHAQFVRETLDRIWDTHSTDVTETISRGQYKLERDRQHKEIVDDLWNDAANVPNDGKALFSGGLGGAGKTTVLKSHAGVDLEQYLVVNADDIKEIMAQRGMVPDIPGLSPMEASALVHREAVHIAEALVARAKAERKNLLRDVTMAGAGNGALHARERVEDLIDAGYEVDALFVDIPVELSIKRMHARHRDGMEAHQNGKGLGGRYVNPRLTRENATPGKTFGTSNRQVFEDLKPLMKSWALFDNSVDGSDPILKDDSGDFKGRMKKISGKPMSERDKVAAGMSGTAKEQVSAASSAEEQDNTDLETALTRLIDDEHVRLTVLRRVGK